LRVCIIDSPQLILHKLATLFGHRWQSGRPVLANEGLKQKQSLETKLLKPIVLCVHICTYRTNMQHLRFVIKQAAAAVAQQQNLRPLSIHWNLAQNQKPVGGNPGAPKPRDTRGPKPSAQKITLIQQNQSMSITTLEEAQKLAKRRDLHLLRLEQTDAKTGRAMFK